MTNLCKCGCGQEVNKNYAHSHWSKGKKYYDLYTKEKAEQLKEERSLRLKGRIFSEEHRKKISLSRINMTDETREKLRLVNIGKKLSEETKEKIRLGHLGKKINRSEQWRINNLRAAKNRIIPKKRILEDYITLVKENGLLTKTKYMKLAICSAQSVANKFGSLDNLANEAGILFKEPNHQVWNHNGNKGKNEDRILDIIEKNENIILLRQFCIGKKRLDGYNPITNTVYEIDEWHHKYQRVQDIIRENEIKEKLKCNFVRINEKDFLENIKNESLENFAEAVKNDE